MDLVSTSGKRIAATLGLTIRVALAAGALTVASAASVQAKPAADAAFTPFCTSGLASGDSQALGLYEVGGGMFSADFADAKEAQACLKATPANLNLSLSNASLNLAGSVQYVDLAGPQRRLIANTIDPVLCESYYTTNDNLSVTLTNANGDVQGPGLLRGISSMSYSVSNGQITPALAMAAYGSYITCASASAANVALPSNDSTRVFTSRFEDGADLQVEYLTTQGTRIDTMVQTVNTNSVYKVRVTNRGETAAQNVRIREFVPKPTGQLTPTMNMDLADCVRDSDNGDCAGGDGTLRQDVGALAPGASLSYTLTRRVIGGAEVPVASGALTSVAVFVDPSQGGEFNPRDNSRSLRIGLVTNGVPTAQSQVLATDEDQAIAIVLTGNDPEASPLNFITGNAQHGSLSGVAPNVTFTPDADYNGPASFTFTVGDGLATSAPATVTINVAAVNDAPRVVAQLDDISRPEGALFDLPTAGAFADPEGTPLTFTATGLPPGVNISSNGTLLGNLSLVSSGEYEITVKATENAPSALFVTDTFVLTVSNTNQNPTLANPLPDRDSNEGDVIAVSIAGNFADADNGDTLTYSVSGGALPPGLSLDSGTGQISGELGATAANGSPYTVTINANDGNGGSVSDSFDWTVQPVNFAPVAVGTLADRNGTVGVFLNISGALIRAGFSDPDGDTLEYSATGLPTGVSISPTDGTIIGVPGPGTEGAAVVEVTASDGQLDVMQSFTLAIAPPP